MLMVYNRSQICRDLRDEKLDWLFDLICVVFRYDFTSSNE